MGRADVSVILAARIARKVEVINMLCVSEVSALTML